MAYKNLTSGQKIKQFRNFLRNGQNKNSLIAFFNNYWRKPPSREKLANKELYTVCGTKCYKLTADTVQEIIELSSGQGEADTRLLLHTKHAATPHAKADSYHFIREYGCVHTMHFVCACNPSSYLSEMRFAAPSQVC